MGILGTIQFVQGIKRQDISPAVKKTEAGMPCTGFPAGHRQKPCEMLYPHQTCVPLLPVHIRIKAHWQRTQPAVQRPHIKLRSHRLQACTQQNRGQLHPFTFQAVHITGPQKESDPRTIEFMPVTQQLLHHLHILTCPDGLRILTHGIFRQPGKPLLQGVLWLYHNGHAQHRSFRKRIHQRIHRFFSPGHLTGNGARLRWRTELLHHHGTMWQIINPPHPVLRIGMRRGKPQAFCKVRHHRHNIRSVLTGIGS